MIYVKDCIFYKNSVSHVIHYSPEVRLYVVFMSSNQSKPIYIALSFYIITYVNDHNNSYG